MAFDEPVLVTLPTFPEVTLLDSTPMSETSPTAPSANTELNKLCQIIKDKGLSDLLRNLPPATSITVEPQNRFVSTYPHKVCIGTLGSSPVWASLKETRHREQSADCAPDLFFYTGHSDAELKPSGPFHSLGNISMVDPFRAHWDLTHDMPKSDTEKSRHGSENRRGQFKSLVYWYLLNDAVGRNSKCHIPKAIPAYFASALKTLKPAKMNCAGLQYTQGSVSAETFTPPVCKAEVPHPEYPEDTCVTDLQSAFDQHVKLRARNAALMQQAAELKRKYEEILEERERVDSALQDNKRVMARLAEWLSEDSK
ncbi:hypothetical protein BKA66DRAFT_574857 [Pyrenochaeta sp. MPI-SDFR-AT-0127]|nr:hypothetical protein BKA66DRAFT_574857 [Pyrenochaeta sp. MPI-SDFR-AT-0127]